MSTVDQQHMMGRDPPKKVSIDERIWFATKLALWRSKVAWDIAVKEAAAIVARCRHANGCEGAAAETEPCRADCPDREVRMSALVVLNAARQFAPASATRPANQPYSPPSREYFSDVIAELVACQGELEVVRGTVVTMPAENPNQLKEKKT